MQLSPHLLEVFHNSPKPREVSGSWTPLPEQAQDVRCLDAVDCRVNALVKYPRGLPIMSPLDHVEFCTNDYADIVAFAYVYVDCPDVRLEDLRQARAAFPGIGSRWYCVGAVIYMLHVGAITVDDCLYGIKASRHMEPKALEGAFHAIRAVMELALSSDPEYEWGSAESTIKRAVLSLIGMWNMTERFIWKVAQSQYAEDAPAPPTKRTWVGEGIWDFKWKIDILDNRSMRPFGQIALDWEQCLCDMAMRALRMMPNVTCYGVHVDGVFHQHRGFDNPVRDFVDAQKYADGTRMFKLKEEPRHKVPTWSINRGPRSFNIELIPERKHIDEHDVPDLDFAQAAFDNGGAMFPGVAGVGKTWTVKQIIKIIRADAKARDVKVKIHACAIRHAAKALLPGGKTISHMPHKNKDAI